MNGALAIDQEVSILKARNLQETLMESMVGKWEFTSTGSIADFVSGGKRPDGEKVLWVIDAEKRLLFLRGGPDWDYEVVLSEDGNSFTAKRLQNGKKFSAKRIN